MVYKYTDREDGELISFGTESGLVVCIEGSDKDARAIAIVESSNDDSCCLPKLRIINYISARNTELKEKQLYKNKATLNTMQNIK